MTSTTDTVTETAIELDEEERELVGLELDAILPALSGERRERYATLRGAVEGGTVPAGQAGLLGSVLELTLQTARTRQLYRAEGERLLTAVYRRTPQGREASEHTRQVNAALDVVRGHTLDSVSVRQRTVGHYTVTFATDAATLTLRFRPDGVEVESVAVGPS